MVNLGVIGKPSAWLISAQNIDYDYVRSKFKINLINIDIKELIDLFHKHLKDLPDIEYLSLFGNRKSVELNRTYSLYISFLDLIKKYKLKGVTCTCYEILEKENVGCCVPFSVLNSKKIIACCESNIPLFIFMYLVRKTLHTSCFLANINFLINEEHEVIVSHCTVPLNMCETYKLASHFETQKSLTVAGKVYINKKTVLFRLSNDLHRFVLIDATTKTNYLFTKMCRTQVGLTINKDFNMDYFLKYPLGNHHLIFYTSNENKLLKKMKKLGMIEVK